MEIRDKNNFPIGETRDVGNQINAMHYKQGYVGFYNKSSDITFDKNGKIYCFGDGLQSLIREAEHK